MGAGGHFIPSDKFLELATAFAALEVKHRHGKSPNGCELVLIPPGPDLICHCEDSVPPFENHRDTRPVRMLCKQRILISRILSPTHLSHQTTSQDHTAPLRFLAYLRVQNILQYRMNNSRIVYEEI